MESIISSSDKRLSTSKSRRLKPLSLRDYLLDDLSSCSSNGFKSFPRRQTTTPPSSSSSTVRRLLDAEIKRSGLILMHHQHKPRRFTKRSRTSCGTVITHAVHRASTVFLNAVKLLTFPSPTVKKPGVFSSRKRFWRKTAQAFQSHREITGDGDGEIKWWRSAAYFSDDETSDLISHISTVDELVASSSISMAEITTVESISGGEESSSSGSEIFTNSSSSEEVLESPSLSSSLSTTWIGGCESEEVSNENDAVKDGGEFLEVQDCDGSYVNRNGMECVNEEKEQLSPVSILESPFEDEDDEGDHDEDDAIDDRFSNQNDAYETRKSRRLNGLVRLEPLDLEKHIEIEEEESENRVNRLFALVKSRICDSNDLVASKAVDKLLSDYLREDKIGAKEETLMVKEVEDWVMGRQEEMFMSWEVREKRQVYVKEMKWGCVNGDERESVVEDLGNGFFTFLVDEFIFDLASS